jgi:tRNA U34 5-methylaminomethyl-2-thiouridine-forming methyltransferase MnmC
VSLQVIQTKDGSSSILNTGLSETYHSVHGALQESRHVFIEHGLNYLQSKSGARALSVFEVGFGTGLNALLAAEFAEKNNVAIDYCSIETVPLSWEMAAQLNYPSLLTWSDATEVFEKIHFSDWETQERVTEFFSLKKVKATIHDYALPQKFDCIFFDAFAPEKQPEMWTVDVLKKVTDALNENGVLVTYCAKGQLRRDLASLNLKVEKLPGPPGKREMTRTSRNFD